jgi:hypothetical protein
MVETVRHSVFETNSSSTHSITVGENKPQVLIKNNILNVINLEPDIHIDYSETTINIFKTTESKLGLLIHYLLSLLNDDESIELDEFNECINYIKRKYSLKDIKYTYGNYCPITEDMEMLDPNNINTSVYLFIEEIIDDDTRYIIDGNYEW